jgi:hypothetical protein
LPYAVLRGLVGRLRTFFVAHGSWHRGTDHG